MYDLYSKFDINEHKKKYINYLECVILEDGTVEYAIPSHQEKGIQLACDALDVTREELFDMCPGEYYCDFLNWLSKVTNTVFIWTEWCSYYKANRHQVAALRKLKLAGVYKGMIPNISKNEEDL